DAVVEYDAEDLTRTVECGAVLAGVRETLAARGQVLPLEGAGADRATVGGVLAANASGARRRAWGAPRDRILGARFVTGDGTAARTGGRVVKEGAGDALHRPLCRPRRAPAGPVTAKRPPGPAPGPARVLG